MTAATTAAAAAATRPSDPATASASSPPAAMTAAHASHASPTAVTGRSAYLFARRMAAAKIGMRSWNDGSAATSGDRVSAAHTASASACDAVTCSALVSRSSSPIAIINPSSNPSSSPSLAVFTTAVARSMEVRNRPNPSASETARRDSGSSPWTSLVTRTMPMNLRSRLSLDRSPTHSASVTSWSPISAPHRRPARDLNCRELVGRLSSR